MKALKYLAIIFACIVTFFALFLLMMSNETILAKLDSWFSERSGISSVEDDVPRPTEPFPDPTDPTPSEGEFPDGDAVVPPSPQPPEPTEIPEREKTSLIFGGRAILTEKDNKKTITLTEDNLNALMEENIAYMEPLRTVRAQLSDGSIVMQGAIASNVLKEYMPGFVSDLLLSLLPKQVNFSVTGQITAENGKIALSLTSGTVADLTLPAETLSTLSTELAALLNKNLEDFLENGETLDSITVTEKQIVFGGTVS